MICPGWKADLTEVSKEGSEMRRGKREGYYVQYAAGAKLIFS